MIDAHVHHWELGRFRYPWLDDPAFDDLRKNYLAADYRADVAGAPVQGWVDIQAEVDHQLDPVRETAWVSALAEEASASRLPGPVACVVYADLRAANLREVLSSHCRFPLSRGVRQEAWFDPVSTRADIPREDLLNDPAWQAGYRCLAEFGLSFDLLVWPRHLQQAAAFIAEVRAVPVALEHLGLPDPGGGSRAPNLAGWCHGSGAGSSCLRQAVGIQRARQSARRGSRTQFDERAPRALWSASVHGRQQFASRTPCRGLQLALRACSRQPERSVR